MLRNLKLAILRHFEVGDSYLIKFRVIFSVGYYEVWVKAPDSSDCGVMQGALVSRAMCGCVLQGVSGGSTFKCLREVMEKALEMPRGGPGYMYSSSYMRICTDATCQEASNLLLGYGFLKEECTQSQIEATTVFVEESSCQRAFRCPLGSRD